MPDSVDAPQNKAAEGFTPSSNMERLPSFGGKTDQVQLLRLSASTPALLTIYRLQKESEEDEKQAEDGGIAMGDDDSIPLSEEE